MAKVLVIGEKSSQVKIFAQALFGNQGNVQKISKYIYIRSGQWNDHDLTFAPLAGHIARIDTNKNFGWGECQPIDIVEKKNSLVIKEQQTFRNLITRLARESEQLWLATDPDSEGDNIAYEAYVIAIRANSALKDNTHRVWNSSLTRAEILRSFNNLREWDINLAMAVQGRRFIDAWTGFAGTREVTGVARKVGSVEGKNILSVGRVQLPTLFMIVQRDREIAGFNPETLYNFFADILSTDREKTILTLKHIQSPFKKKSDVETIRKKIKNEIMGTIADFTVKETITRPPKPLNTTDGLALLSKQMKVNAERGLKLMADLYEAGYLSYPRTDNRRFKEGFPHKGILDQLSAHDCLKDFKVITETQVRVNGKKIDVEDHDPIYPTGTIPQIQDKITDQHFRAWTFFARYYIGMFMRDLKQEKGTVNVSIKEEMFAQDYSLIKDRGWTEAVEWRVPKQSATFSFEKEQEVQVGNFSRKSYQTKPPRRWSDATIIKSLEKERIGTKSSRPDVLKKLVLRNYIIRQRNVYQSTETGQALIEIFEPIWPDMITSVFTRSVEEQMDKVAKKTDKYEDILEQMRSNYIKLHKKLLKKLDKLGKLLQANVKEEIIDCPKCDGRLVIRQNRKTGQKFYGCNEYPKCKATRSIKE